MSQIIKRREPPQVFITRPIGTNQWPYAVSRVTRTSVRTAHVADLAIARRVADEWRRADYSFEAGGGARPIRTTYT